MKRPLTFLATALLSLAVLYSGIGQAKHSPPIKGKWGFGVRSGVSVYTSGDIDGGDTAPIVSGLLTYGVSDWLNVGFNAEWEEHDVLGGDFRTISLLPSAELRANFSYLVPYFSFGLGINLNSFDRNSSTRAAGVNVDPDDTVAFKVGLGADYFLTRAFALNTELGWKFNNANSDFRSPLGLISNVDTDASAFSALFGFRYYFRAP